MALLRTGAARVMGCRIPRCAAPISSPTRRRRSTALDALRDRLPVGMDDVREALVSVELPGRFQVLPGRPVTVLDVAHNPQAARALADTLGAMGFHPATLAVFGIMADKDIDGVIAAMQRASIDGSSQRCRLREARRHRICASACIGRASSATTIRDVRRRPDSVRRGAKRCGRN